MQVWAVEADTVIESEAAIDTLDIVFIVFPDCRLIFRAPAVSLKRGQVGGWLGFVHVFWCRRVQYLVLAITVIYLENAPLTRPPPPNKTRQQQ